MYNKDKEVMTEIKLLQLKSITLKFIDKNTGENITPTELSTENMSYEDISTIVKIVSDNFNLDLDKEIKNNE